MGLILVHFMKGCEYILDKETLEEIKKIAQHSFDEWHAGLNAMLNNHDHFAEYVDKNYRVSKYDVNQEFFMTSNERYFHLIGFMDAIVWFHRTNFFKQVQVDDEDYEFIPENDHERAIHESAIKMEKAIHQFIINFETGD